MTKMTMTEATERAKKIAADNIDSAEQVIVKFKKNLEENPAYAFEWSEGAFEAAAKIDVNKYALTMLTHEKGGLVETIKQVRHQVLRGARNVESSTSHVSNLVNRFKTASLANLLESLEDVHDNVIAL